MESTHLQCFRRWATFAWVIGVMGISVSASSIASAHTTLVSTIPSNGAEITHWPSKIKLTFAEDLQTLEKQEINFVTVNNANGQQVSGSTSVVKNVVTTTLNSNDVQGLVLVNYRVAAQDGHVVEGEFTFTYGKSSDINPNSSPSATVVVHQERKTHMEVYATTTVLIVIALVFGLWIYKRD